MDFTNRRRCSPRVPLPKQNPHPMGGRKTDSDAIVRRARTGYGYAERLRSRVRICFARWRVFPPDMALNSLAVAQRLQLRSFALSRTEIPRPRVHKQFWRI